MRCEGVLIALPLHDPLGESVPSGEETCSSSWESTHDLVPSVSFCDKASS